jgi:hypothetical protein
LVDPPNKRKSKRTFGTIAFAPCGHLGREYALFNSTQSSLVTPLMYNIPSGKARYLMMQLVGGRGGGTNFKNSL